MRHGSFLYWPSLIAVLLVSGCGNTEEPPSEHVEVPKEVPMPIPGRPHIKRPLFVASGIEPDWTVSVFQDTVRFRSSIPGIGDQLAPTPAPELFDKGGRRYKVATPIGELIVDISAEACTDTRSGVQRPNTTRVTLQPTGSSTPTVLNGCGRLLTQEAIEGSREQEVARP